MLLPKNNINLLLQFQGKPDFEWFSISTHGLCIRTRTSALDCFNRCTKRMNEKKKLNCECVYLCFLFFILCSVHFRKGFEQIAAEKSDTKTRQYDKT